MKSGRRMIGLHFFMPAHMCRVGGGRSDATDPA